MAVRAHKLAKGGMLARGAPTVLTQHDGGELTSDTLAVW